MDGWDAIARVLTVWVWASVLLIPLGIWKLVEIVIWILHHLAIV